MRTIVGLLAAIGALAIVVGIACVVFFFGGFFDVSATYEDSGPVAWSLIRVREASMDRHAASVGKPPFALDSPNTIQAGARHYAALGCVNCHGAPGAEWAKFSEGLNPGPPDLKDEISGDAPEHIFWVVKNGIRMTGMPSFAKAGAKDNDIWQVTAFIKALPKVSDADYKSWTASPAAAAPAPKP